MAFKPSQILNFKLDNVMLYLFLYVYWHLGEAKFMSLSVSAQTVVLNIGFIYCSTKMSHENLLHSHVQGWQWVRQE